MRYLKLEMTWPTQVASFIMQKRSLFVKRLFAHINCELQMSTANYITLTYIHTTYIHDISIFVVITSGV